MSKAIVTVKSMVAGEMYLADFAHLQNLTLKFLKDLGSVSGVLTRTDRVRFVSDGGIDYTHATFLSVIHNGDNNAINDLFEEIHSIARYHDEKSDDFIGIWDDQPIDAYADAIINGFKIDEPLEEVELTDAMREYGYYDMEIVDVIAVLKQHGIKYTVIDNVTVQFEF